jgi:hypothetical protein
LSFEYPYWSTPISQQVNLFHTAMVLAIVTSFACLWLSYRERNPWRLYVLLGACFCVLYEPLGDVLTAVAYPPGDDEMRLFATYGRNIPSWMLPNYIFFITAPLLLINRFLIVRFVSLRTWLIAFLGIALFMGIFEQPGIKADAWRYYASNGPLAINTYPLWVAFANAQAALLVATAVYLLRKLILPRTLQGAIALLLPLVFAGSHVSASLVPSVAQYSSAGRSLVNAAAATAVVVSLVNVLVCWKALYLSGCRVELTQSEKADEKF